jgi:beta-glucosidase
VLLENKHHLLPLCPEKLSAESHVLVVGPLAKSPRIQGGGSSQVNADDVCSPWEALNQTYSQIHLDYANGYAFEKQATSQAQKRLREEAVNKAEKADAVLLFLGLPDSIESESWDRKDMNLPQDQ